MPSYTPKHLFRWIGPLFVALIFAAAVWLLLQELRRHSLSDVVDAFLAIPAGRVWLSIVLTVLNYLVLIGYDVVAMRIISHPLRLAQIALASFVGYAFSYNFGAVFGGTSVRYRLYSSWGLTAVEIVKILAVCTLTFWIGFFALAGVMFVVTPVAVPDGFQLPFTTLWPLGVVFLLLVFGYLAAALRKRSFVRWGWTIAIPSFRLSLCQIGMASLDLIVAGGAVYVLLPDSLGVSFATFLCVYLLAVVAVLFTHVPGGLGVFEVVILLVLSPNEPDEVMGALLAFRAIYYLLPLLIASAMLAVHEFLVHRNALRKYRTTWQSERSE